MRILIVLLIGLALSKLATDPKVVLAEIDNNHMGKTFLNAIQISLATGSPVHEIQSYINNIRFIKTPIFISKIHKPHVTDCFTISLQTWHIIKNTNNLQRSLNKIAEVSVEIEENSKKTNAGQSERDLQYAEFQSKIKDHAEAISAIDEAYALIEHLSGGSSFIQVKGRFNKVLSRLQSQSTSSGLLFQPILTMMTQLSAKSDSDTAKKVLQLLSNLRVQIVESKSSDEDIEKQQSLNWQQFLSDLTNERNTLSDQRQNLEQAILNYQSIIEESQGKVEYHAAEVERNQSNLDGQDQWCRQQQDIYQMETQSRVQLQDLISRISDHIQDKIVTLKEYLRERLQLN
ncbi:unnamed protein product (macronuclear) [Paramecium tetraurelia]|uniref:Trichocyst matrix protein n=1 Tax=Paramecium tetraurelia TaxID=5888 RepID=A0DCG3_PARTE|nr:uncharacterized protein GSPATT00015608001 [Paramecium tetraurelia]CAK80730.1 unnamed protein product [Paramecium tetraurelia]|eukprot:XP_001448127.1 hypothetical protein (macronuclear) [Paramecium tetraurelia strain d4-2]